MIAQCYDMMRKVELLERRQEVVSVVDGRKRSRLTRKVAGGRRSQASGGVSQVVFAGSQLCIAMHNGLVG